MFSPSSAVSLLQQALQSIAEAEAPCAEEASPAPPPKKAKTALLIPTKKKEEGLPSHGSVGHLRQLLRAASITIPPNVYVRAKAMAAEGGASEQELVVFALREILASEGLSVNSTPAELARVARKRELAKDMEGVDTANVIEGSRRRGTGGGGPPVQNPPPPPSQPPTKPPAQPADSDEL